MATSKPAKKAVPANRTAAIIARFNEMAEAIPTTETETGLAAILSQIDAAETPEQLDNAWTSSGGLDLLGHRLVVHTLKRLPSSFADGLNFFLVVTANDLTKLTEVTFTTGAVSVVGQLVKAYTSGWFPMHCKLVQSDRPTPDGYYPQHLEILADEQPF